MPFFEGFLFPAVQEAGGRQDAVNRRGAGGDDVTVEHHEGEATIAFEGKLLVKGDDASFLLVGEPVIAWHQGIVLIGLAVAFTPIVELAAGDADPADDGVDRQLHLGAKIAHEVDDDVARIVRNPSALQGSPSCFFNCT